MNGVRPKDISPFPKPKPKSGIIWTQGRKSAEEMRVAECASETSREEYIDGQRSSGHSVHWLSCSFAFEGDLVM